MPPNQPGLLNIEIAKYHSMGEDFGVVVLHDQMNDIDLVNLSKNLCNRRGLIGADGVVFIVEIGGQVSRCRFFRPNGVEIALSLSGLRCAGRYLGELVNSCRADVATKLGTFRVEASPSPASPVRWYKTTVPRISKGFESLCFTGKTAQVWDAPVAELGSRRMFAVELGEPHLVTFPDDPMELSELVEIGRTANSLAHLFPYGVNASAAYVVSENVVFLRTYGRCDLELNLSRSSAMLAVVFVMARTAMNGGGEIMALSSGGRADCRVWSEGNSTFGEISSNCTLVYSSSLQTTFGGHIQDEMMAGRAFMDEIDAFWTFVEPFDLKAIESRYFT